MRDPLDDLTVPAGQGALDPAANPFAVAPGAIPPHFGGRQDVLEDARAALQELLAGRAVGPRAILEGVRGVGKTALMARMRTAGGNAGLVVVHVEANGEDATARASAALLEAINQVARRRRLGRVARRLTSVRIGPTSVELAAPEPTTASVRALLSDLGTLAREASRGVFVTIDEAHEDVALAAGLVGALHACTQDHAPVAAYLAGLPGTRQRIAKELTYAERIPVDEIGMLTADEVAEAVREPFADVDVSVEDAALEALAEASGGYPYFVQCWGRALWNAATDPDRVDMSTVSAARPAAMATITRFLSDRWGSLAARQQDYVAAIARQGSHEAPTGEVARALGKTTAQASYLRSALISRGVLYAPEHGVIGITIPGLAEWVREHRR